jgi:hypothetical protein
MDYYLAIHGGLEYGAFFFKIFTEGADVNEVAVVGNCHSTSLVGCGERLGVNNVGSAGGGITYMADGNMAFQALQDFFGENIMHEPHGLVLAYPATVGNYYAGAFLAAVLQGVKPEVGQFGCVNMTVNATDATFFPGTILIGVFHVTPCIYRKKEKLNELKSYIFSLKKGETIPLFKRTGNFFFAVLALSTAGLVYYPDLASCEVWSLP